MPSTGGRFGRCGQLLSRPMLHPCRVRAAPPNVCCAALSTPAGSGRIAISRVPSPVRAQRAKPPEGDVTAPRGTLLRRVSPGVPGSRRNPLRASAPSSPAVWQSPPPTSPGLDPLGAADRGLLDQPRRNVRPAPTTVAACTFRRAFPPHVRARHHSARTLLAAVGRPWSAPAVAHHVGARLAPRSGCLG